MALSDEEKGNLRCELLRSNRNVHTIFRDDALALLYEIDALRAQLASVVKTEDGVPLAPGLEVVEVTEDGHHLDTVRVTGFAIRKGKLYWLYFEDGHCMVLGKVYTVAGAPKVSP